MEKVCLRFNIVNCFSHYEYIGFLKLSRCVTLQQYQARAKETCFNLSFRQEVPLEAHDSNPIPIFDYSLSDIALFVSFNFKAARPMASSTAPLPCSHTYRAPKKWQLLYFSTNQKNYTNLSICHPSRGFPRLSRPDWSNHL